MKIAVLDDYADAFRTVADFSRLDGHEVVSFRDSEKDPARQAARLGDFDVVVLMQQRSPFRRAVIEKLPRLKLVVQTGGHRDHLDIEACTERGIAIARGRSGKSYSTAELTWGLILSGIRHIPYEVEQMKRGRWQSTVGTELHGKTLGVYGLGKIGTVVAHIGAAFGMQVTCWGRSATLAKAQEAGYVVPESRQAFFESADVLTLHIHYLPETRGIVTAADLARMKSTALLVNTGRAGLIAEGALVAALRAGRPGHAAVDVYEDEPVVGGNHPLLGLSNAICTPHLGYAVRESYENHYNMVIANILAFASGHPANIINPEALGKQPRI